MKIKSNKVSKVAAVTMAVSLVASNFLSMGLGFKNNVDAATASSIKISKTLSAKGETVTLNVAELPNFGSITSVTSDNGTISNLKLTGDKITFTTNATKETKVQTGGELLNKPVSKFVSGQASATYKDAEGYTGTLSKVVVKGSEAATKEYGKGKALSDGNIFYGTYTFGAHCSGGKWDWKTESVGAAETMPDAKGKKLSEITEARTYTVNDNGVETAYKGTLSLVKEQGAHPSGNLKACAGEDLNKPINTTSTYKKNERFQVNVYWTGKLTKPDTRVYAYQGMVTKPADTRTYKTQYVHNFTVNYNKAEVTTETSSGSTGVVATNVAPEILTISMTKSGNSNLKLAGQVKDENGDKVVLRYAIINSNGTAVLTSNSAFTTTKDFEFNIDINSLVSGTYTIQIFATDDKGLNAAKVKQANFTLDDKTGPVITIGEVKNGKVEINVSDVSGVKNTTVSLFDIKTNESVKTIRFTENTKTIDLSKNGNYAISVTSTDKLGNTSVKESADLKVANNATIKDVTLPKVNVSTITAVNAINLTEAFNDFEFSNKNVTYRVVGEDSLVKTEVKDINGVNYLNIKGLKEGNGEIQIFAKNSTGVESAAVKVKVEVKKDYYEVDLAKLISEYGDIKMVLGDGVVVYIDKATDFLKNIDTNKNSIDFQVATEINAKAVDVKVEAKVIENTTGTIVEEIQVFEEYVGVSINAEMKDINAEDAYVFEVVSQTNGTQKLLAVPHVVENGEVVLKTKNTGDFVVKEADEVTFTDIETVFSVNSIEELNKRGVVKGVDEWSYNPNANITRAEFAVMLARGLGLKPSTNTSHFDDVKGTWFEGEVQALYEAGLIAGIDTNLFGSLNNLTRQDAMVLLTRVTNAVDSSVVPSEIAINSKDFVDYNATSDYAKQAVDTMVSLGIIAGRADGDKLQLQPTGNLTRAEMAKILHFSLEKVELM